MKQLNLNKPSLELEDLNADVSTKLLEEILNDELNAVDLEQRVNEAIDNYIKTVSNEVATKLISGWKERSKSNLLIQEGERELFRKDIAKHWEHPLDLLEISLSVCLQEGATIANQHHGDESMKVNYVFEALIRLHGRGCQVASEALLLLRNGFADGAHARWRTLHEISVEATYIGRQGQDVAERFLNHSIVTEYKVVRSYNEFHKKISYSPPNPEQVKLLKKEVERLISKYGKEFKKDYGWAAHSMGKDRVNFYDLEKTVGLDHLRPFYRAASINVHSGSLGSLARLGDPISGPAIIIPNASVFGLREPGQNIAFTFFQLTAALLLSENNLDNLVFLEAAKKMMHETFWAFDDAASLQEQKNTREQQV